jgi:hypothetical protein
MARGYYLVVEDETTCGGIIIEGDTTHTLFGRAVAREEDRVTCGKHPGTYYIIGHIPGDKIHGRNFAGTLHSKSSCPCEAEFIPSMVDDTYDLLESLPNSEESQNKKSDNKITPPLHFLQKSIPQKICTPSDNKLLNGVFIWTETTAVGHVFISVHDKNSIYLYSYGRYGLTGIGGLTGEGILNFLVDEDAREFYRNELYHLNARVFRINDADLKLTRDFFENLWMSGKPPTPASNIREVTSRRGRTIDMYDVTGRNCTTHSIMGIKKSGSKVFMSGYTPITTQFPIEAEEDFTIPTSLQKYLINKSRDLSSMVVLEMTNEFKNQYPNIGKLGISEPNINSKIQKIATESASVVGKASPYSAGTIDGILGDSYDME